MGKASPVRRFATIALAATLTVLVGAGIPAGASGAPFESGVVFRDQRPVSIESGAGEATRTAVLCNALGREATDLRWSLGGFQFTNSEGTAVAGGQVTSLTGTTTRLAPGACATVKIAVAPNPGIGTGPFTGKLVVTSSGSGVARLDVSVAGPASTVTPTKGAAETIELTATKSIPWSDSVSVDGDSALALEAPPEGKELELAKSGAFIGNLVNAGDVASVFVTGDPDKSTEGVWLLPIEVRGAADTGEYEGTLKPTASADDKQTVKAKVKATVWWPWAVAAVLAGALLVLLPTLVGRRWKPERKLHERHRGLADSYSAAGEAFHQRFPDFAAIETPSSAPVASYAAAVDSAIRAYAKSSWYFDTTSDAYTKIVQSLDAAKADIQCLESEEEDGLGPALTELKATLICLARELSAHLLIDRQPAIALAASALLRSDEELVVGEATIRAQEAEKSLEAIEQWTGLAQALWRYEVWYRVIEGLVPPSEGHNFSVEDLAILKEAYATISVARNELLEAEDAEEILRLGIKERLTQIYSQLARLGAKYSVWVLSEPSADSNETWPTLKLKRRGNVEDIPGAVHDELATLHQQLPDAYSNAASWRENASLRVMNPAQPVELRQTKWYVGDGLVLLLSVATGTVAALSAFYFGKTWGNFEDFITVIFVGTVAQAFLKPVTDTLAEIRGNVEPVTESDPVEAVLSTVTGTTDPT